MFPILPTLSWLHPTYLLWFQPFSLTLARLGPNMGGRWCFRCGWSCPLRGLASFQGESVLEPHTLIPHSASRGVNHGSWGAFPQEDFISGCTLEFLIAGNVTHDTAALGRGQRAETYFFYLSPDGTIPSLVFESYIGKEKVCHWPKRTGARGLEMWT